MLLTASQALRPDLQYTPQALQPEVFIYQLSFQKESWSKKSIRISGLTA